jgi:hypothetical protein
MLTVNNFHAETFGLRQQRVNIVQGRSHSAVQNYSIQSPSPFLLMCNQWLLLWTPFHIIQYNDDYCVLLCIP